MLFQVTEIDFDFTDSEGELPAKMQKEFIDLTIGQIYVGHLRPCSREGCLDCFLRFRF